MLRGSQFLQSIWNWLEATSYLEICIGLLTIAGLSSYLYIKHQQRVLSRPEPYDLAQWWTRKPIDVTKLKPAVEQARLDYLSARQPPKGLSFHTNLLGLARRAIAGLAYFRDKKTDSHQQGPAV